MSLRSIFTINLIPRPLLLYSTHQANETIHRKCVQSHKEEVFLRNMNHHPSFFSSYSRFVSLHFARLSFIDYSLVEI